MIIACFCYRDSAEEHESNRGECWNRFLSCVSWAVGFVNPELKEVLDDWLEPRPLEQHSYLDVHPNINSHTIIYKQIIRRGTETPYEFKFYDPAHIITGIACGPQDDKTSSPEAEVVDGGIGSHHVVIRLSPVQKEPWACSIEISGTEENSVLMT